MTLLFSDFLAFERLGEPITGHKYLKKPNGPILRNLLPVLERMREAGDGFEKQSQAGPYTQHRFVARRPAKLSGFSADEIALVDEVIEMLRSLRTTSQLSDFSHRHPAWVHTHDDEEIDYALQLLPHPDDEEPELTEAARRFIEKPLS